jgi:acetyl esterase
MIRSRAVAALAHARMLGGRAVVDGFFEGASRVARLHPRAKPEAHGIEVLRDLPYLPTGRREHLLDVWRPVAAPRPMPVVF